MRKQKKYKVIKKFPVGGEIEEEVFLRFWDVATKEVDKARKEREENNEKEK